MHRYKNCPLSPHDLVPRPVSSRSPGVCKRSDGCIPCPHRWRRPRGPGPLDLPGWILLMGSDGSRRSPRRPSPGAPSTGRRRSAPSRPRAFRSCERRRGSRGSLDSPGWSCEERQEKPGEGGPFEGNDLWLKDALMERLDQSNGS